MKKFLFVLAVVFGLSATAMAQQKGDKFIGGAISATTVNAATFNLGVAIEGGGFVADRWALSGTASYDLLNRDDHMLVVAPQVAYYVRLADRLYYTPEVGVSFDFGSRKEQLSVSESYKTPFWGWNVYANLLALEFKVSEKLSIGALVSGISYGNTRFTDKKTDAYLDSSQFNFDLNNSSVQVRFYF